MHWSKLIARGPQKTLEQDGYSEDFPVDQGLCANTMMLQQLGDAATDRFNKAWFNHFIQVSCRDQISLPYVMWKKTIPPALCRSQCLT
jgi:hypothetical protein